ncbi:MAG: right-handed parallel beta-helix repeat-containing protein [Parvularcula sp.]
MILVRVLVGMGALLSGAGALAQETLAVGPGTPFPTLEEAVAQSGPGDTLVLAPAQYDARDIAIDHDLILVGGPGVRLTASDRVQKGLLVPGPGTVVTVKNVVFAGATSADRNGAGIRFEGKELIVDQCTFRNNENGILATGDPGGSLTVSRSYFTDNGSGDGYSHAIYQSRGAKFSINASVFAGTKAGHHLKILARDISVTNNRFDDGEGKTSYVIDMSAGGNGYIVGNEIIRRSTADRRQLFNYDTSRGGERGSVFLSDNVIVTEKSATRLFRNPEGAKITLSDNAFRTEKKGSFRDSSIEANAPPRAELDKAAIPPAKGETRADVTALSPAQSRAVRRMLDMPQGPMTRATGLLRAPQFPARAADEVASFAVEPIGTGSRFVTFGQTFAQGRVMPNQRLGARIGKNWVPVQIDTKATHPDGSVRHALVTLEVPSGSQRVRKGVLVTAPAGKAPIAEDQVTGHEIDGWVLEISGLTDDGLNKTIKLASLFQGESAVWLDGPLATEKKVTVDVGPLLEVSVNERIYADGTGRLRLTFDNHKTFSAVPRSLAYSVVVRTGKKTLFDETIDPHYRNSGWTATVPIGSPRGLRVMLDPQGLIDSGAVPPFDLTTPINAKSLPPRQPEPRPGDVSPLTAYMPTTGGRGDLGPMTAWGAAWAITQSAIAEQAMLRIADIGLTIPWHFEEDGTGLPVRADWRPRFWADDRGAKDAAGADKIPKILFAQGAGGWTTDVAHKPTLAYPAYLATGEQVYLRALRHEAAYAINGIWPDLRGKGTLVTREIQLRSVAWSLRSIGNAAFILPDDDPFKAYMQTVLADNLTDLVARFIKDDVLADAGETKGYLGWDSGHNPLAIAPWQNDYAVMVLSLEAIRGSEDARRLVEWMTNYIAGRVLAAGEEPGWAAVYDHAVLTRGGDRYATWDDLYTATRQTISQDLPYAGEAEGGYGVLRGALGAIDAATGDPRAKAALRVLRGLPDAEKLYDPENRNGRLWNPQFSFDRHTD